VERAIGTLEALFREAGPGVGVGSLLNIVITDGHSVVVTRYAVGPGTATASLYYAVGTDWVREDATDDLSSSSSEMQADESCGAACRDNGPSATDDVYTMRCTRREPDVLIVASERLTPGHYWRSLPDSTILVCDENVSVSIRPIQPQQGKSTVASILACAATQRQMAQQPAAASSSSAFAEDDASTEVQSSVQQLPDMGSDDRRIGSRTKLSLRAVFRGSSSSPEDASSLSEGSITDEPVEYNTAASGGHTPKLGKLASKWTIPSSQ